MLIGTAINVIAILAGTIIGLALKQKLPERISSIAVQSLGLVTMLIGLRMVSATQNPLIILVSMIAGGILGELLRIEERLGKLGMKVESKISKEQGTFAKAFVTSTLLYCVGPMAIVGSLQDGLHGDYTVLLTKSVMDGIASVAFASTLGIGVLFSTLPLAAYQVSITLGASLLKTHLTASVVTEMTATGGLLILGIAMNMLQIAKIRVANLLPAIVIAAVVSLIL
jgi:uncharacterized membrane protein YqgA involved in biofilm formation